MLVLLDEGYVRILKGGLVEITARGFAARREMTEKEWSAAIQRNSLDFGIS